MWHCLCVLRFFVETTNPERLQWEGADFHILFMCKKWIRLNSFLCLRFSCRDTITWHTVKFVGQCVLFSSNFTWKWMACLVLHAFLLSSLHIWGIYPFLVVRCNGGWKDGWQVVRRVPLSRDHWLSVVTGFHIRELKGFWVLQGIVVASDAIQIPIIKCHALCF